MADQPNVTPHRATDRTAHRSLSTRLRQRMRGSWRLALLNFWVAAAFALTTATLGLVVEDLLPQQPPPQLSAARLWFLTGALLLLLTGIWARTTFHRFTGTLFYVRLLDDVMPDRHTAALAAAKRSRMSTRSVTRWVDLSGHTRDGVIDLTGPCRDVAAALESAVNTDRDDTGTTIAPNLLWQPALAVGAELPIVDTLRLLELGDATAGSGELSFTLQPAHAVAGPIHHETSEQDPTGHGRVGLVLAFGKAATSPTMQPTAAFVGFGVTEWHRLRPGWLSGIAALTTTMFTADDVAALAGSLPAAVADVKKNANGRDLVVVAALPKTLALALGWHLGQSECRFFAGTYLLHFNGIGFQPMRVHPAQPAGPPHDVSG